MASYHPDQYAKVTLMRGMDDYKDWKLTMGIYLSQTEVAKALIWENTNVNPIPRQQEESDVDYIIRTAPIKDRIGQAMTVLINSIMPEYRKTLRARGVQIDGI